MLEEKAMLPARASSNDSLTCLCKRYTSRCCHFLKVHSFHVLSQCSDWGRTAIFSICFVLVIFFFFFCYSVQIPDSKQFNKRGLHHDLRDAGHQRGEGKVAGSCASCLSHDTGRKERSVTSPLRSAS